MVSVVGVLDSFVNDTRILGIGGVLPESRPSNCYGRRPAFCTSIIQSESYILVGIDNRANSLRERLWQIRISFHVKGCLLQELLQSDLIMAGRGLGAKVLLGERMRAEEVSNWSS
jgi:hypothetical protein